MKKMPRIEDMGGSAGVRSGPAGSMVPLHAGWPPHSVAIVKIPRHDD